MKKNKVNLSNEILTVMFDPKVDAKRVDQRDGIDMIAASSVNFHAPEITQQDLDQFYKPMLDKHDSMPLGWGLNRK